MLSKELRVDSIDGRKVIHVLQENLVIIQSVCLEREVKIGSALAHRRLDDLPDFAPARLNDFFQVLQCLAHLRLDAAFDKRAGFGIEAEAARHEDERRAHDGLAVRPNRGGRICRSSNQSFAALTRNVLTFGRDFGERRMGRQAGHFASR